MIRIVDCSDAIRERYPTQTAQLVRLEEMGLAEALRLVAFAKVAIGMHGSILILTMFMAPGSTVKDIEEGRQRRSTGGVGNVGEVGLSRSQAAPGSTSVSPAPRVHPHTRFLPSSPALISTSAL